MPKLLIAIGASLVAGFAIAAMTMNAADSPEPEDAAVSGFDDGADIIERLRALELAINAERQARQLLEEELFRLYEELESIEDGHQADESVLAVASAEQMENDLRQLRRDAVRNARRVAEQRRDGLIAAGFSAARADWILNRESELRMEAMQDRYEAMRSGEPFNPMMRGSGELKLRDELGDAQYEQYLAASNSPTTVGVGAVFDQDGTTCRTGTYRVDEG